jgi:hypothetical protein
MDCDFSGYKLLVAPMLYMLKPGVAERIEKFVKEGGTLVTTYCSGMVDENDLCYLGGFPGPLRKVLGIWDEETDGLYNGDQNYVTINHEGLLDSSKQYCVKEICDIIHCETAQVLGTYKDDFYTGKPAGNEQIYETSSYIREYDFVGMVTDYDKTTGIATVEQRNRMFNGETVEVVSPLGPYFLQTLSNMKNIDNEPIDVAPHPQMTVYMPVDREVQPFTMLRRKV